MHLKALFAASFLGFVYSVAAAGELTRIEYELDQYDNNFHGRTPAESKFVRHVVDWILRGTEKEDWVTVLGNPSSGGYNASVPSLNATRSNLSVVQTPEKHEIIKDIVERCKECDKESLMFRVALVSVNESDWRVAARTRMQRASVESPGINAWLMTREHAIELMHTLTARADYQQYNTPEVIIENAATHRLGQTRSIDFIHDVKTGGSSMSERTSEKASFDDGWSLEFSPLMTLDGKAMDVYLDLQVHRLESFTKVSIRPGDNGGDVGPSEISIPRASHWGFTEQFRVPTRQILVIDSSMTVPPFPAKPESPELNTMQRSDVLLFVWYVGRHSQVYPGESSGTKGRY